jgi:hypothetical protein
MDKFSWQSRKVYRDEKGHIGKIVYSDTLKRYLMKSAEGPEYLVNQNFAKKCHATEEHFNTIGRPSLFPTEDRAARLITLPRRLWEKLGDSYSFKIAELVEKN